MPQLMDKNIMLV